MAEDGYEPTSDELWANTNPTGRPAIPPNEPTVPAPTTPDPTMVQPTVGGAPPPLPPGGGPPPPGGGPPDGDPPERPAWLLPVAAGLIGSLVLGLVLVLLLRDDGNDNADTGTTLALTGTTVPGSSIPETTIEPTTTSEAAPETTLETTTTSTDEATTTTTEAPETTTSTTTTSTTTTTTTTTAPPPVLPDPGFATVDGVTYPLQASCFTVPLSPNSGEYQVASYLVTTNSSRLVLDRWSDEGNFNGLDGNLVDTDEPLESSELSGESVNSSFTATMTAADGGSPSFDVAVNPPVGGPVDCFDTVQTRNGDNDEFSQYTRAVVDICTTNLGPALLYVVGIASEGGRFEVVDDGADTVELTYSDPTTSGPLTDPAATLSFDETIVFYDGRVVGEGSDPEIRNVLIEVEFVAPRECDESEVP
jgi:hypothetical protein